MTTQGRYLVPSKHSNPMHRAVAVLAKAGVSLQGSRVLYVRGRTSGKWRENPVNLLAYDGERYLVAPRGHTQWVRNLRAAGTGRLRLGRRYEDFTAAELTDDEKGPVLRAYLKKWAWESGVFFEGLKHDSPEEELRRAAPGFPVFRLVRTEPRS